MWKVLKQMCVLVVLEQFGISMISAMESRQTTTTLLYCLFRVVLRFESEDLCLGIHSILRLELLTVFLEMCNMVSL